MLRPNIIVLLISFMVALPAYADINTDLLNAASTGDTATVQSLLGHKHLKGVLVK